MCSLMNDPVIFTKVLKRFDLYFPRLIILNLFVFLVDFLL